ncbi:MAG: hypothetical protein HY221_01790 [Candidatus Sungbacteria bacterium]|uniref:Uncharacterized protein n=1 Tax=Candidatus Sungiibacteriota bacterium TaxID=2750080 RepID=A0A932R115_9BACT|nr:hypothetical protein [Candidatus Sungbacteria bacterium]
MTSENESKIKKIPLVGFFWDKSFLHYLWTGGLFTVLNIILVSFAVDVLKFSAVGSSSVIIGGLFFLRYVLYRWIDVM